MKNTHFHLFPGIILFVISLPLFGQNEQSKINPSDSVTNEERVTYGIIAGGGFNRSGIAEIDFGRASFRPLKYLIDKDKHNCPEDYMVGQIFIGSEFVFHPNQFLVAPKVGLNGSIAFFNFTYCNFLYYTDFKEGSFSYRPEAGISIWGGRLFYGYNIPISNKDFLKNYRHHVGFTWFFKVGKSIRKQYLMNKVTKAIKIVRE